MKKMYEPILFFGSGPVASQSLQLLAQNFTIKAVVTKPAAPHYHGNLPVLDMADKLNITVHTASNKQELVTIFDNNPHLLCRAAVLVDFGIIIPISIIKLFPMGIINSHFSLLPKWRGADPITFAILSGQSKTGVSLMLLVEPLDEGPLLSQSLYTLHPTVTTPELTDALTKLSYHMLSTTLPLYIAGKIKAVPQNPSISPTYSRKLTKSDGLIDWHKPATQIEREIRAFIIWPKSYTTINAIEVIITRAHVVELSGEPGQVVPSYNRSLAVYCGQQALEIEYLKPLDRKEMSGQAFLAGHKLQ